MRNLIVSNRRKSSLIRIDRVCFLLLCLLAYAPSLLANNPLRDHPSPYIRLHAQDAVQWRLWAEPVLQQARSQNKLILVSIGYYACHWCHVMREESFNDPAVARLLNEHFIPVKVDRELNPALDDYLMDFLQKTRGYGGWPLNVFITPEGYPLLGMVYLPREEFIRTLSELQGAWTNDTARLTQMARDGFAFSQRLHAGVQTLPDKSSLDRRFMQSLKIKADDMQGGLGDQAKFPQPALLQALLTRYRQQPDDIWLKDYLRLTLKQIAGRGLHDVIGGGFFRYTIDPDWQTPHFEKMLYTNAGLIQVYTQAFEIFGDAFYLDVAQETADFLLRDMRHGEGGFISSLSAQDAQGMEGGSYIWDKDVLRALLTDKQWRRVKETWQFNQMDVGGVLPMGFVQGGEWGEIRQRLLQTRNKNSPPRDDKFIPSWNAYALSALARLCAIKPREDLLEAGDRVFALLMQQVKTGLTRRVGKEQRRYLEDYAFVAQGLFDWHQLRHKTETEHAVKEITRQALALFLTREGWRLSDEQIIPLPGMKRVIPDGDLPSPAVILASLAKRLDIRQDLHPDRVDRFFWTDLPAHATTVMFALDQ